MLNLTRVVTLVSSRAHVFALGRLRSTGDGRVQHREPAVTRELVKTYKPEGIVTHWRRAVWLNAKRNATQR